MDPRAFLQRAVERFGPLFVELDRLRERLRGEGKRWPAWCLLPDQLAQPKFSELGLDREQNALDFELAMTAYQWRRSRDVFRFPPKLLRAMIDSQVQGLVGVDALRKLPESCVYIEAPGLAGANGFFARLDFETVGAHEHLWLRFLALGHDAVLPLALRFGLGQSVEQALHHAQVAALSRPGPAYAANASSEVLRDNAHALVSLVLCLCYARDDLRQELESGDSEIRLWSAGRRLLQQLQDSESYDGATWELRFAEDLTAAGFGWGHPNLGNFPLQQL